MFKKSLIITLTTGAVMYSTAWNITLANITACIVQYSVYCTVQYCVYCTVQYRLTQSLVRYQLTAWPDSESTTHFCHNPL